MIAQKLSIPVFDVTFDDANASQGVKVISFVEVPAIESGGIALGKIPEQVPFKFSGDEKKYTFTAPVLIPNKKIYRQDAFNDGNPYFMVFDDNAVTRLMDKFMKEKLTDVTDINHDGNVTNSAYLIECFQLRNSSMVKAMVDLGLDELPLNTWMVTYKVKDKETYAKFLANKLNGLSVEAYVNFQLAQLTAIKPEINMNKLDKNKKKNLLTTLLSQIKEVLLEEIALAQYVLEDGSIIESDEAGKVVSPEGIADGDYKLAPDQEFSLLVVKDGAIVDKKSAAPAEAKKEEKPADPAKAEATPAVKAEDVKPADPAVAPKSKLAEVKTKDGKSISVDEATQIVSIVAEDGSLTPTGEGDYELEDGSVLVVDKDSKLIEVIPPVAASKIAALSAAINDLNAKLTEATTKLSKTPASPTPAAPKKVEKVEMGKMSVAQRAAYAAKQRMTVTE
jgi:hypothetical protein